MRALVLGAMEHLALTTVHRKLLFSLLTLFCLLVGFKFHGYSINAWHSFIDGSSASEVLLGRPRMVRGDDYFLDLPSSIAQTQANPAFPMLNQNIGMGQFMVAPIKVPVRHFLEFFRPSTWGYFLGPDFGLSWNWWFGVLGLFYSGFLLFLIISKGDFWISFFGSLALVNAPFFQCWSFHKVEIAIHALNLLIALFVFLSATKPWQIYLAGLISGWFAGCFVFDHMYPAFQITLVFFMFCLVIGMNADFNLLKNLFPIKKPRFLALCMAIVIFFFAVFLFISDCSQTLNLINQTIYPGQRFSVGGGGNLWTLFNNHFFTLAKMKVWKPLGNPSEAGHFLYFFPLVYLLWVFNFKFANQFKALPFILLCLSLFLLYFYLFGFSNLFSKYTLLFKVTSNRLGMVFGLINFVILVYFGSLRRRTPIKLKYTWSVMVLWTSFLAYIASQLRSHIPELPIWFLLFGLVFNVLMSYLLIIHKKPLLFFQVLAMASIAFTFGFNPIARGGVDFILNNPLSTEIKKIHLLSNAQSKWATLVPNDQYYGYTSLLRMLGVPAIDGHHGHPHFDLWKQIDPTDTFRTKFNQSGYVSFIPNFNSQIRIDSSGPGKIEVFIPNNLDLLRKIGITHVLYLDLEENKGNPIGKQSPVFQYSHWKLFNLN